MSMVGEDLRHPTVKRRSSTGAAGSPWAVARWWCWWALFAALMVFVVKRATAGPEEVVHQFLTAAAAGDYAAAHEFFSAPLKEAQPLEKFTAIVTATPSLFQIKDTTFSDRSVDLSGAKLSGTVTLAAGTQVPASFQLVKENGAWKLLGYRIGMTK